MKLLSKKLDAVIEHYEKDHRHPTCIRLHDVGIPLVTLGTMSLMGHIPNWGWLDFRYLLLAINLFYFVSLDALAGFLFTLVVGGSTFLASKYMSLNLSWIVFITGWALAISGHVFFEKNRPAFFDNLSQTLLGVGPMALFIRILRFKRP
jgi:uncharacterized membrane protein YGL010W